MPLSLVTACFSRLLRVLQSLSCPEAPAKEIIVKFYVNNWLETNIFLTKHYFLTGGEERPIAGQ